MTVTFAIFDLHPERGGDILATEDGSLDLKWDSKRKKIVISPFLGLRFKVPPRTREPKYLAIYSRLELILVTYIKLPEWDKRSNQETTINYDWELIVSAPNEAQYGR